MCLKVHWTTYVQKYHSTFTFQAGNDGDEAGLDEGMMNDKENEENVDDNCLVSLPGKVGVDEMELNDKEEEERDDDLLGNQIDQIIERGNASRRQKKQRVFPV
jgi:hypothetical protein